MPKPTLADLLGTKGYKTEKILKDLVAATLKRGAAIGTLGKDHRMVFKPNMKLWYVEPIEDAPPPVEEEFGSRMQGGNANPEEPERPAKSGKKAKKGAHEPEVAERLARVKAEASGEAPKKKAAAIPLPPLDPDVPGPFILVIEDFPEASDPRGWALDYSRKLKVPVAVYAKEGAVRACVIDAKVLRPPRKGTPAARRSDGPPQGFEAWAIEQALREEGVLRKDLREQAGRKRNWTNYLRTLGERYGYELLPTDRSGPDPRYRIRKT